MNNELSGFLAMYPGLDDPATATSQCRIASGELVERLNAAGVPARLVWVRGHRVAMSTAVARALAADRHAVVGIGGRFIDVARRQFDSTCPHPRMYASESDLAQDWREIDDGPPGGGVEEERWRDLSLEPW